MTERFDTTPQPAWTQLTDAEYDDLWSRFEGLYGFRASTAADRWPAIHEPAPSITFDLSVIDDGPRRGAAYDAINAEALRCFVWALDDVEELVVLDWQHPAYSFRPTLQAATWDAQWRVPVYPDGDYYAFLTPDLREGTFGHPWEQTLCVIGDRLGKSLGRALSTWLPMLRSDGVPVGDGAQR
jgi:hypothetical protein